MLIQEGAMIALVTIGAVTDVHKGIIPNGLTYPAWVFGACAAALQNGWPGFSSSLLGFAVGFVPFFVLYVMGGLGGGDVKLMAAVGMLMGYPFVANALITSILIGGLVALLIVIWEGKLWTALRFLAMTVLRAFLPALEPERLEAKQQVPFGVAICLGSFLTLLASWQGFASPSQLLMGLG